MRGSPRNRALAPRIPGRGASLLAILLFAAILAPTAAMGISEYEDGLPDKGLTFECQTCHNSRSGGGPRNAFGTAFGLNNLTYDEVLAASDSDGDGFTNGEELAGNPVTNPGDAGSFPTPKDERQEWFNPNLIFLIAVVIVVVTGCALIWRKHE